MSTISANLARTVTITGAQILSVTPDEGSAATVTRFTDAGKLTVVESQHLRGSLTRDFAAAGGGTLIVVCERGLVHYDVSSASGQDESTRQGDAGSSGSGAIEGGNAATVF